RGEFHPWQLSVAADLLDARTPDAETLARLGKMFQHALLLAITANAPLKERVIAIRLLARTPERTPKEIETLASMLSPNAAPELQAAAVAALGRVRVPEAVAKLLANWKGFGPAMRAQAAEALFRRDDGVKAILAALDQKQIDPSELDAAARQRLLT